MMKHFLFTLILSVVVLPMLVQGAETGSTVVVTPRATNEALINPSMGWVHFHYSNRLWCYGSQQEPGDTLDWFPGCSTIYFRIPWCYLEPQEGQYRWDLIDTWAAPWIQKGKKIAFRVIASEDRFEYATPKWVMEAGAKGIRYRSGQNISNDITLWDPLFDDPVFLEKLGNFLQAMGKRYNGNPHVAFIDIGSFGLWGEGHTVFSSKLNQEKTDEVVKKHIDLHKKYFPDSLLCISDDVAGAGRKGTRFPSTDYAFSKGVTLRDDSIMVGKYPRQWYHAEMAQLFWPTLPVILEHGHYDWLKFAGTWDKKLLVESVEAYHASYMSLHGWPEAFLKENREAIDQINQRLGYRLELRKIEYPQRAVIGQPLTIGTTWANVGVAPCYPGGYITFTLKNSKGNIVWSCTDETFNVQTLPTAPVNQAREIPRQSKVTFGVDEPIPTINEGVIKRMKELNVYPDLGEKVPTVSKGEYDLYLSIGKRDSTPEIALPLEGNDGYRRYKIGCIRLE